MRFDLSGTHGIQTDFTDLPQHEEEPSGPGFDLSGTHGIQRKLTDLPQHEDEPSAPGGEFSSNESDIIILLGLHDSNVQSQSEPGLHESNTQSLTQSDEHRSALQSIATAGTAEHNGYSSANTSQYGGHQLVQDRVMEFQKHRAEEKARTMTNIARLAGSLFALGLLFYISGTISRAISSIVYYGFSAIGVMLMGMCFVIISACLLDLNRIFASYPIIRISLGVGLALGACFYTRFSPHIHILGVVPMSMLAFGYSRSEHKPRLPFSTSLLSCVVVNFDLGGGAIYWRCFFQAASEHLTEYCSSWAEGKSALLAQACWSTAGVMYSTLYFAWRQRWFGLNPYARSYAFWHIFHATFVIQGIAFLIGGASKLTSGSIGDGSGLSVMGLSFLLPAAIMSIFGSSTFFELAVYRFEVKQGNMDSAFMARLLDDVGVTEGQAWYISDASCEWKAGKVVQVTDVNFTVRVAQSEPLSSSRDDSNHPRGMIFGRISSIASGTSVRSAHHVDHILPLGGRQLSALQLLDLANSTLRCVDWSRMSFELFDQSSMCGKVEGRFCLSRPLKVNERIDFFLSHSWHDDPLQKWTNLQQVAETFFQEFNRYPTFWLDRACIDQSNIADGLKVLPIYVMACRRVLALAGETYPLRLWCVWELFTVFAFAEEGHALSKVRLIPTGTGSEDDMFKALLAFDSSKAHCFDPNEELRLRRIIDTVGKAQFESRIRRLSQLCFETAQLA